MDWQQQSSKTWVKSIIAAAQRSAFILTRTSLAPKPISNRVGCFRWRAQKPIFIPVLKFVGNATRQLFRLIVLLHPKPCSNFQMVCSITSMQHCKTARPSLKNRSPASSTCRKMPDALNLPSHGRKAVKVLSILTVTLFQHPKAEPMKAACVQRSRDPYALMVK